MSVLVNDLLDYTRVRSGHGLSVSLATCDLRRICEELIDALGAANPQQQFHAELVGDLVMQADEKRLEQLLANLLSNAAQHGGPDNPVTLAARGDVDTISLAVKNLGHPIPPSLLPTIFEPLVQGAQMEGGTDLSRGSIGLGLFIVREIVRGHQGTIDVESSEGDGTTFSVKLPRTAG